MRVALFGANGQLGQAIRSVAASPSESFGGAIQVLSMERSDVRVDEDFLHKRLRAVACDAVINCAAWTNVDEAESHQKETWSLNAEFPSHLARATSRLNIPLVHISTEAVFSGKSFTLYAETDNPDPISVYGQSKLAGEVAVLKENSVAIVMRTSWLYSANSSANFPSRLRSQLSAGNADISVVTDVVGNPTPSPLLARAVLASLSAGLRGGLYHVACQGAARKYDWAIHLCNTWGFDSTRIVPSTAEAYSAPAQRSLHVDLSTAKFMAAGVIDMPAWQEASTQYWSLALAERKLTST